jgi:acyl-CoA synthetase (AMP-forming)/AMP-acid ligase II
MDEASPAETPGLPDTIPAVVARAAREYADLEALVDDRDRLTFAQLADSAVASARSLLACGVEPGDRVAIWAPNTTEWVHAALGVYAAGGVIIPLNTRFKGAEAAYIVNRARAKVLFTVTDFLDTNYLELLDAAEPVPSVQHRIVLRGAPGANAMTWTEFLARGGDVSASAAEERSAALSGDSLSDILFTSGTTGRPKGAMLTHGASVKAYDTWATVVGLRAGDRYLIVNPFFHAFGLKAGILASLVKGATIVPHAVFDVEQVMRRVAEEHVSMLPGPPTIYQSILDHPRAGEFDLSSLRLAVTGAAPVPMELIRRMREELKFENVVRGFGLTEATGIATMCRHDDPAEWISETEGRAIPGTELRIVDDDNRPLAAGEAGEVVIRGYNVMQGFLDDPEATAEAIDADGWLHTGDVGTLDENDNLRITDRKKDMFIVGGFNAYPAEIENMLSAHPAVSQAAIVGVPDARLGEVGYAYLVLRPGATVDADEVISWCRERMANYKVPRHVQVVDALPLNASGKVLKFELRDRATSSLPG